MRYNRFTFGISDLAGGISLIPALVGAFGFAEVLTVLTEPRAQAGGEQRRFGAAAHRATCCATGRRSCARA